MDTRDRIWKGKIVRMQLSDCTAWGIRTFKIDFATGSAIYILSQKQELKFKINDFIYFKGQWFGERFIMTEYIDEQEWEWDKFEHEVKAQQVDDYMNDNIKIKSAVDKI